MYKPCVEAMIKYNVQKAELDTVWFPAMQCSGGTTNNNTASKKKVDLDSGADSTYT
jgi:hypothetical protein